MPKKILIVDDDTHVRILLEQTLEVFEDAGVEVLLATNGREAWDAAQAERPDVIVLDVMMPGISGYEVCERIKGDPDCAHAHVIMLTAKGQARDHQRGIEVGADEYVTKPFSPRRLVARVADVLDVQL